FTISTLLRAEIEVGRACEEEGHDIVIESLVRTDCAGEIPAVDRGFVTCEEPVILSGSSKPYSVR
ncbi:MAG: hypothetical protein QOG76_6652, partial [Pseudonocardiales bacterium]|nr:hypothetical protein [Pseudonocardiales bacterium]